MKHRQLVNIIDEGENLYIEFKQRFSSHEKIAKEIIAFANTSGGKIIFGVNDNKSVCGVYSEKETAELIQETCKNFIEPPVEPLLEFLEFDGKEIVILTVEASDNKPHRIQDYEKSLDIRNAQVFVRIADKSVHASKEMIKILQARATQTGLTNYEVGKNEKLVFEYLDEHETITVKQLGEIANISRRRASRTLIKLVRVQLLNIHTGNSGEDFFTYAG